jgi:hypothetical protein
VCAGFEVTSLEGQVAQVKITKEKEGKIIPTAKVLIL